MVQVLYSIAAIMLLGITVLNINTKIHGTQDRIMFSEVAFEMTSVGAEVLNEIGKHAFDPGTISEFVVPRDSLSEESEWAATTCDPDNNYQSCFTVSDFHAKSATRIRSRTWSGTPVDATYNVTDITVRYVSETPPHTAVAAGTKTFAKEVTLTVSTPVLLDADGDPLEFTMSRVYMYPNI